MTGSELYMTGMRIISRCAEYYGLIVIIASHEYCILIALHLVGLQILKIHREKNPGYLHVEGTAVA